MTGPEFPKTVNINIQGRHPEFEAVAEVPFFTAEIDVQHKHSHNRNRVEENRVFIYDPDNQYHVQTTWGRCITNLRG